MNQFSVRNYLSTPPGTPQMLPPAPSTPQKVGSASYELQQVLFRLSNLEHFLLSQRHEDLAWHIARQVVEQLREGLPSPLQDPGVLSPLGEPVSARTFSGESVSARSNTDEILRDTDAIINEIGPGASGLKSQVPKVSSVRYPISQFGPEVPQPHVQSVGRVTEIEGSMQRVRQSAGDQLLHLQDEDGEVLASAGKRRSHKPDHDEAFAARSASVSKRVSYDRPPQIQSESNIESNQSKSRQLDEDADSVRQSLHEAQAGGHAAKIDKLRKSLQFVEDIDGVQVSRKTISQLINETEIHRKDNALDLTVAAIIVLNAIVIGLSMDYKHAIWKILDFIFTVSFLCELGLKFKLHGVRKHFSSVANCFDFCLVVLDVTQLVIEEILRLDVLDSLPAVSMFRVIRLARLTRLIRLARLVVFDELVAMITGLVGGMTTLMWSIVFFGLIVYITALLFREFYGNRPLVYEDDDITSYFLNVPRSMYTTFRFFFGDFTTATGISIFEAILVEYGTLHAMFVALLFFVITIGLFNVIAAIFVESTLAAAYATQNSRKTERMNNDVLWGRRISILVGKFFECIGLEVRQPLSECLDEYCHELCPAKKFELFIKDPIVVKALCDLEISDEDHKYLFDILDNDNTGDILVSQLSDGVERLRGEPRRSDIICVDLMVRSIQEQMNYLCKATQTKIEFLQSVKKGVRRIETALGTQRSVGSISVQMDDLLPKRA